MINTCSGINKKGQKCKNKVKNVNYCWLHTKSNKNNKIDSIPNEIYIIIYDYLEFNDKINLSSVNRRSYTLFKKIIEDCNIRLLLNKDIKASYYIKKYLENKKVNVYMNLDYNKTYFKGLEEIDYKISYNKKEIIIYKKHIYENNGKNINFGFETKRLKCIDEEIEFINDLLEKLKLDNVK